MKRKLLAELVVAGGVLLAAGPMFAHHSQAVYDTKREVVMTATVTEIEFVNPHVLIHMQVKDDKGKVEDWLTETGPPNNLRRSGWTPNTIKPGDHITVTVHVARDGSKEAHLLKLVVNGKELYRGPTDSSDYR